MVGPEGYGAEARKHERIIKSKPEAEVPRAYIDGNY